MQVSSDSSMVALTLIPVKFNDMMYRKIYDGHGNRKQSTVNLKTPPMEILEIARKQGIKNVETMEIDGKSTPKKSVAPRAYGHGETYLKVDER